MRRDRNQAALVRAYAERENKPIRTAQHHAKHGHPAFLAFAQSWAPGDLPATSAAQVLDFAADPVARAGQLVAQAWANIEKLQAQLDRSPQANLKTCADAVAAAHKTYRDALAHDRRVQVEAGRLIPADRLAEIERDFLGPLKETFAAMDKDIGAELPELTAPQVIDIIRRWRETKVYSQLRALTTAVESAQPAPDTLKIAPALGDGGKGESA